ncbi:uncharacterized protein [Haliotis cracherodii]|uniref:uncharacterized protein n=1 Tax=Haliotis cracherodii TaxID=6455 RepID=UPI0039EB850D
MGGTKRVCVSSISRDTIDITKYPSHEQPTTAFGSALLAGENVVSRSRRTSRKSNIKTSKLAKSSLQSDPSKTRSIRTSRMEHIKSSLVKRGYAMRAAKAVSLALRRSTWNLYDDKWKSFDQFATSEGFSVAKATIPQVADYLCHLRSTRHLKGSTLGTYLAAFSSVLTMANGIKLTKVPELIALLRSFRLEDQQKRFRAPAWDLNIVLQHLTSDAYELLQQADFERLTQKTLFILALAAAARISEIHAIDFNHITFDSGNNSSAHIGLRWDFIAKNQLPGQPDRQFHVLALSSVLGAEDTEDLSLCPVRALRLYLRKSKPRRQGFKRLFIPLLRNKHTEVSRTTISF